MSRGKPSEMLLPVGTKGWPVLGSVLLAQTDVANGQVSGKKATNADSSKNGGFSHKPWAPWFQEES